jgi:hypothetical protein
VVSAWRTSSALWRFPAMVERDISRKLDWTSAVSSVAGSDSDGFFSVGKTEVARLCCPQKCRRSRSKTSSSCDNAWCELVKSRSTECRAAPSRLPWNWCSPPGTPTVTTMRPWFDHLIACANWRWRVSWKVNVTGHTLHSIFTFFLARNRTIWCLCANFLSSSIYRIGDLWLLVCVPDSYSSDALVRVA